MTSVIVPTVAAASAPTTPTAPGASTVATSTGTGAGTRAVRRAPAITELINQRRRRTPTVKKRPRSPDDAEDEDEATACKVPRLHLQQAEEQGDGGSGPSTIAPVPLLVEPLSSASSCAVKQEPECEAEGEAEPEPLAGPHSVPEPELDDSVATENAMSESELEALNESIVSEHDSSSEASSINDISALSLLFEVDQALKSQVPLPPQFLVNIENAQQNFSSVCSRLALLRVTKYSVSIGEVSRRVFGPEEFSFSLLGGLLRRAKMPNSTNNLKAELEEAGVFMERGRRRTTNLSLFGSLVEAESIQLAKDYKRILDSHFPHTEVARKIVRELPDTSVRQTEIGTTKKLISEFLNVINRDSSPIDIMYPPKVLEDAIQNPLEQFSMLTHGFGTPGMKAVLESFLTYLDAQSDVLST